MAQQAQQMSAGRLTICLSLCYGVTFHSCVCVARLAAVKSLLAVLGFTWLSPQCALIVSRFCLQRRGLPQAPFRHFLADLRYLPNF